MFDELPGADRYDVEEEIGHGTFSEVHRARDRRSGGLVALKHSYLPEGGALPRHVLRELAVLRAVHHPRLVSLLDYRQQDCSVALVLEHCTADLRTLLEAVRRGDVPPPEEAVTKALAQQLLQALAALHAAGFVHRDVGPSNVLLAADGTARLADFGQARRLPGTAAAAPAPATNGNGMSAANGAISSDGDEDVAAATAAAAAAADALAAEDAAAPAGSVTPGAALCTRWYKAPELLFNSRAYTAAADLWGAACVLAELLRGGRPLFAGSSDIGQLALMADLLGSIREEAWPGVRELPDWGKLIFRDQAPQELGAAVPGAPPAALALLAALLVYDPQQRLTAEQALASPWFAAEPAPAPPEEVAALVCRALA